jgi:hypothetical protein
VFRHNQGLFDSIQIPHIDQLHIESEEWRVSRPRAFGNLGLTAEEETAIVAFLKTLSDGYKSK